MTISQFAKGRFRYFCEISDLQVSSSSKYYLTRFLCDDAEPLTLLGQVAPQCALFFYFHAVVLYLTEYTVA